MDATVTTRIISYSRIHRGSNHRDPFIPGTTSASWEVGLQALFMMFFQTLLSQAGKNLTFDFWGLCIYPSAPNTLLEG